MVERHRQPVVLADFRLPPDALTPSADREYVECDQCHRHCTHSTRITEGCTDGADHRPGIR